MTLWLTSLLAGLIFGLGLAISQMVNPEKVLGFLDITGNWDPSLALVMFAAVTVGFTGFRLVLKRSRPLVESTFRLPEKTKLDRPLTVGSILFGVGWGIAGYCPGPAVANLSAGSMESLVFVVAMLAGFWLYARFSRTA